jgi:hypothetical protein
MLSHLAFNVTSEARLGAIENLQLQFHASYNTALPVNDTSK